MSTRDDEALVHERDGTAGSGRIDPDASPKTIEKQIDAKRADIDRTLSELEQRLSPGQMVDRTIGLMRDNGGEMFQNVGRSFRDNPMPYLLTGLGIAWAMASSQGGGASAGRYRSRYGYGYDDDFDFDDDRDGDDAERYRYRAGVSGPDLQPHHTDGDYVSSTGAYASGGHRSRDGDDDEGLLDKARDRLGAMGERLSETGENLSDKASELGDDASRRYHEMRHRAARRREAMSRDARYRMDRMRRGGRDAGYRARYGMRRGADTVSDFMHEQPMVAGALGVAVGALIGSLLPASEIEDRYVGEYADDAKRVARAQAASGVERVREEAESGMQQAREKVEEAAEAARGEAEKRLDEADDKARDKEDELRDKASTTST